MSTSTISAVLAGARQQAEAAGLKYEAMVSRLAADEDVPAEEALAAAGAVGKTVEHLEEDVARRATRAVLAAEMAELPARVAAVRAAAERVREAEAERGEVIRAADQKVNAAVVAWRQAQAAERWANDARRELIATADPALKRAAQAATEAACAARRKADDLSRELAALEKLAATEPPPPATFGERTMTRGIRTPREVEADNARRAEIAGAAAKAVKLRDRLAAAGAEADRLEAEARRADAEVLRP